MGAHCSHPPGRHASRLIVLSTTPGETVECRGMFAECRGGHPARGHSAATIGLDEGTALAVVQELLDHSDIRVTRGYTHVSSALPADGAERVGRVLFGPGATKTAMGGSR